jgi:DNA topoisomerase-2
MQDYLANEIQMVFEKLTNQARFVQMIVNKDLVVSNRKKIDIVADLRKHKFHPFSKTLSRTSAKTSVDTESAGEDNEGDGTLTDFDYLLGMPIWSLTKEKVGLG